MSSPLVSVILPAYNSDVYLREAIESVLAQKHRPIEIILVDDGSTDGTSEVARGFSQVKYIYQRNSGPAAARNRALKEAKGDFIAFIDADDIWPEDKLEIQLPYLTENPDVDVVIGHVQCKHPSNKEDPKIIFENYGDPLTYYLLGSAVFRKAVFEKTGGFDESFPTAAAEDVDLFFRARDGGAKMVVIKEVTLLYRLHAANTTCLIDEQTRMKYFFMALKKSIDRRKK